MTPVKDSFFSKTSGFIIRFCPSFISLTSYSATSSTIFISDKSAISRRGESVLNWYSYQPDDSLRILSFEHMTEKWLDFVVLCRKGIEHNYDIVEGPMADDQIWNYVESFLEEKISRKAFWELVRFSYPTHQMVFCTENALKTLRFEGSDKL